MDTITVLEPWDTRNNRTSDIRPGKTFTGSDYAKAAWQDVKWWNTDSVNVRDLRELLARKDKIANRGKQIIVRGHAISEGVKRRISNPSNPDCNIQDVAQHWAMIDFDGAPNPLGIDVAQDPVKALDFLMGLLPSTMRDYTLGWDWSSSSGLPGKQDRLSAHLWVWFDEQIGYQDLKSLLKRLNLFAQNTLATYEGVSVDPSKAYIDCKMAEPQQPYYVARPQFLGGAEDPHPEDERSGVIDGIFGDVIPLELLLLELDELEADPEFNLIATNPVVRAKAVAAAKIQPKRTNHPALSLAARPPAVAALKLKLSKRQKLLEPTKRQQIIHYGPQDKKRRDIALYIRRSCREISELVYWRVESGAWDPRWVEWHQQKGIPSGSRARLFTIFASLYVETLRWNMSVGEVRAEIAELAAMAVSVDWYRDEWLASGYDVGIIDRYMRRSWGERVEYRGKKRLPTYAYSASTIIEEFGICVDEMEMLNFNSLTTKAMARKQQRIQKGVLDRVTWEEQQAAKASTHDAEIAALAAQGLSVREIAAQLDISKSTIARALGRIKKNNAKPALRLVADADLAMAA